MGRSSKTARRRCSSTSRAPSGPRRFWRRYCTEWRSDACGSGLASQKGCAAAPAMCISAEIRGRFAALSRHKAAPTRTALASSALLIAPLQRPNCIVKYY
ncbi:hypothetical protein EFJ98_16430 [Pseudomonas putida]|nr:hypothetical protein EFJ98_16430 [Pseudomonas putida]